MSGLNVPFLVQELRKSNFTPFLHIQKKKAGSLEGFKAGPSGLLGAAGDLRHQNKKDLYKKGGLPWTIKWTIQMGS